jgi:hypothetical protein
VSSTEIMKSTGVFIGRRKRKGFVQRTTEEGPSNVGLSPKGSMERLEDIPSCVVLRTAVLWCEAVWSNVWVSPPTFLLLVPPPCTFT